MSARATSNALGMLGVAYLASIWFAGPLAMFPASYLIALSAAVRRIEE